MVFAELIKSHEKVCREAGLNERRVLENIFVLSPKSADELQTILQDLTAESTEEVLHRKNIRLLVVDSLTFLVQGYDDNPLKKTQIYFHLINSLRELSLKNIPVLVVHEIAVQLSNNGKQNFDAIGGNFLIHRANKAIELVRKNDEIFEATIIKSLTMPQCSTYFRITKGGMKDVKTVR